MGNVILIILLFGAAIYLAVLVFESNKKIKKEKENAEYWKHVATTYRKKLIAAGIHRKPIR